MAKHTPPQHSQNTNQCQAPLSLEKWALLNKRWTFGLNNWAFCLFCMATHTVGSCGESICLLIWLSGRMSTKRQLKTHWKMIPHNMSVCDSTWVSIVKGSLKIHIKDDASYSDYLLQLLRATISCHYLQSINKGEVMFFPSCMYVSVCNQNNSKVRMDFYKTGWNDHHQNISLEFDFEGIL